MYKYINKKYVFLGILFIAVFLFLKYANILKPKYKETYVFIDEEKYVMKLEDNKTVEEFLKLLPLEVTMHDLNNNEKYVYLDSSLPKDEKIYSVKKGDVMLYGDNCLVIFYKNFKTNYKYTKIGHIKNLKLSDNEYKKVKFEV